MGSPASGRRLVLETGGIFLLVAGLLAGLASCANPQRPGGGPRDETPPTIVDTRPDRDTVNVPSDTRSVYVEFSEYVERSTLQRALTVTPPFDQRLRFSWSGRGVTIEFPESLRDSTTYLLTFDTNLSDAHGVSLDDPLKVAFSTGPRINRGQVQGRVVEPQQGQGQARVDVYAYALPESELGPPDSLPDRPAYRTQTAEDGSFRLEYMREQEYFILALRDNNRNRRPDPAEPYAVPPRPALAADSGRAEVPVPWLLTQADTLRPQFQQVQPLSRQRLRLSFNEPIQLASRRPADWTLRDSVADAPVAVRAVYRAPARDDAVILRTATMEPVRHTLPLTSGLVTDTLDQPLVPDTARFEAVSRVDTTRTRFRTFVPEGVSPDSTGAHPLLPDWQPGIRFNQAPDSSVFREVVIVEDTMGRRRSFSLTSEDGRTYRIQPDSVLLAGESVDVTVDGTRLAGPDTTYQRRFRRVTNRMLGELEGEAAFETVTRGASPESGAPTGPDGAVSAEQDVAAPDTGRVDTTTNRSGLRSMTGPLVVELIPTQSSFPLERRRQVVAPGSTFVFQALPQGTFRFRVFRDRNENGRWDGGKIRPFAPAEALSWSQQTTDSRPRWTTELSTPLRIPVMGPRSTSVPAPDTTAADSLTR